MCTVCALFTAVIKQTFFRGFKYTWIVVRVKTWLHRCLKLRIYREIKYSQWNHCKINSCWDHCLFWRCVSFSSKRLYWLKWCSALRTKAVCSCTVRDKWEILLFFFLLGQEPTNYLLSSHLCSQLALPLSFNFTTQKLQYSRNVLARLMLYSLIKAHELRSTRITRNWQNSLLPALAPFSVSLYPQTAKSTLPRAGHHTRGAVSSLTYMKVSRLNRKDDLFFLVTISFLKIIWS